MERYQNSDGDLRFWTVVRWLLGHSIIVSSEPPAVLMKQTAISFIYLINWIAIHLLCLSVCGSSKYSPVSIVSNLGVTRQLRHMGSHFGIRNARMVADVLEQAPDTSPYCSYAMLRSYMFGA